MKKRYQVLAVLAILSMITFLDRIALSSASKRIIDDLHLTTSQWGWILGMFTIAYAAFEIPTGWLGDKIGGKKVLVRVVLWWSFFTILTGFSTGFLMLMIVRFLFGMGEAGAYPNSSIVLSKWFPANERGTGQAVIWGFSRIGAALTPWIVIPIQQHYGWPASFYFLGALGVVWTIFWIFWHKEDPTESKDISKEELDHILEKRDLPAKHEISGSFINGLKSRNLWFLLAMYFCYAIGAYFFQSWFFTYLQKGRGISESDLYWAASLPYLLAAVGCFTGGYLSDYACTKLGKKWGRRIVPMIGLFVSGICIIIGAMAPDNTTTVICLAFGMAFMDFTAPVAWAAAMDMGGDRSGTVSGTMNTAGLTGAYLSTVSFGYLASSKGYDFPVMLIGCILVVGAFIWFRIDTTKNINFELNQ